MRSIADILLIVALGLTAANSDAHPGLHQQIKLLTAELRDNPRDIDLLLRRADQYRRAKHFRASSSDLRRAATIKRHEKKIQLGWARLYLDQRNWAKASTALKRYFRAGGTHAAAYLLRAQWHLHRGKWRSAVEDYSHALRSQPNPQTYLDRGRLLVAKGQLDEAAQGYRQGLELTKAVVLRLALIAVEVKRGAYPAALVLVDAAQATSAIKADWRIRRSEILRRMGKAKEAAAAARLALAEADQQLRKKPSALNRLRRAKAYAALGDKRAARADLRMILGRYPQLQEARDLLQQLSPAAR